MSGAVVWLTGLPASGKSTLARAAAKLLAPARPVLVLDSDEVRAALKPTPGFSPAEREAFYETLARLAALAAGQGQVVLVAATAHRRAFRERARALTPVFHEVFVDTPPETCRARDPKGLYASHAESLPGAGVAYEAPEQPALVVRPGDTRAAEAVAALVTTSPRT